MPNLIDSEYFSIDNLVKTELPPLSSSIMRISALLSDLNSSQNAIAAAISLDPILSSRVLRLANSAVYALHGTVTNLASAVSTRRQQRDFRNIANERRQRLVWT